MADDAVLRALAAACPAARAADASDAVAGVAPRYAASPASVAEASAVMRVAAGQALTVVPRAAEPAGLGRPAPGLRPGGGHAAGGPGARARGRGSGGPGPGRGRDAATRRVLAAAGQQLALDPAPGEGPAGQERRRGPAGTGTVGGTLATAPQAHAACVTGRRGTW